jgi:hypothetical protein
LITCNRNLKTFQRRQKYPHWRQMEKSTRFTHMACSRCKVGHVPLFVDREAKSYRLCAACAPIIAAHSAIMRLLRAQEGSMGHDVKHFMCNTKLYPETCVGMILPSARIMFIEDDEVYSCALCYFEHEYRASYWWWHSCHSIVHEILSSFGMPSELVYSIIGEYFIARLYGSIKVWD